MQVRAQSRARFVVLEFKSDKYSDPRVGSGAKAVVPFSENEIIGEYIGEVKKREENMSNYCVDIGEGYVIDAEKKGNAMNFLDYGLIVGVSYNINRGFYIGVRADIGLADITNNDTDISRAELSENNTYIYRDDKDTHFGLQGSFGFRF